MEKFATENLILLEFLVDQINMDYEVQKEVSNIMGETCVSFQFLDNAPLLICEQDFANKQPLLADQNVKSGKSCLFSLTPEQAQTCSKTFDICVEVFRKMAKGVLPDQVPIGTSLISIVNLFNELVESINTSGETPAAKTLKDCFKITNTKGDDVGHISVYIRMSCFGKLIVTQFQMNLEDKSVQFKAKEGHYLFKYNKGKGGDKGRPATSCDEWQRRMMQPSVPMQQMGGNQPLNPTCPQTSCKDALMKRQLQPQQQQLPQMPRDTMDPPKSDQTCPIRPNCPGIPPIPSVPPDQTCPIQPCIFQPNTSQMPMGMQMGYPQQGFPQPSYPQVFPMDSQGPPCAFPSQQMQQSMTPCAMQSMPQMSQMPQLPCGPQGGFPFVPPGYPPMQQYPMGMGTNEPPCKECAQPQIPPDPNSAYQEIGAAMGGNAITIRVHKDKAKVEDITDSEITESESCDCDSYGKKRKKVVPQYIPPPCLPNNSKLPGNFRPQPGPDQTGPFNIKMAGCGQAANNNVVVSPPTCTAKDGAVITEISDPNKEIFVLRIGKKSEGADKKNNLELELCTPKGPEIKPAPKKETVDTQYDEADIPADSTGKKDKGGKKGGKDKAKGDKGKGGKGGKGKDKGKGKKKT